ncbi:MAG: acyl-CoA dehydrogenase family protein [Sulfuricaulis sp.]|nr:acyl-CoA dehydrogenase family protein [Sulfuricaulis sp.]
MKNKLWLDETDAALDDAATRYTRDRYRFEDRHLLTPSQRRFSNDVWMDMAEMGWLGVSTPEEDGGLGVRLTSICLLAEVAGRALINEPLTSCGFLAPFLVAHNGSPAQRAELLPRLLSGHLPVACVLGPVSEAMHVESGALHGRQAVVVDGDMADHLLVLARDGDKAEALYLVDANGGGVNRKSFPLLDGRSGATVTLKGCAAILLGNADMTANAQPALWLAVLATAADSLGAMSAAFDLTLDYLKTRRQFGKPLGTYQALQHRAVDMYLQLSESRAVLDQAIESVQADAVTAERDVHAAKTFICQAARKVLQEAIQLHGGIGITDEYMVSHYLRRVRVNEQLYGSAEQHFRSFATSTSSNLH